MVNILLHQIEIIKIKSFLVHHHMINIQLFSFRYIPDKYKSYEMCKLAVQKTGSLLHYIKEPFYNEELCKLAVENIGEALEYVPYKDRDENLCRIASQSERTITDGSVLEYIPQYLHTEEICKNAVNRNVYELRFISPYKQQRYGLFSLAIKKNPHAIRLIPHFYLTQKLCDLAYNKNKYMIHYIPDEFKKNLKNNSKL
jgi:hypothetical protein